jgi:transaldolase
MYVEELIGAETVNTMPEETIRAFQDHGKVAPTLESGLDEAKRILEQLAQVGVDYDDVTATLEKEGIQKFTGSFEELLKAIEAKRQEVAR